MQISAKELAVLLNGTIEGDPDIIVNKPSKIEEGGKGTISFFGNDKYEKFVYTTTASLLLVNNDFKPVKPITATLLRVSDVYTSIAKLLKAFGGEVNNGSGIAKDAFVDDSAVIAKGTSIDRFTVVDKEARIGNNCTIFSQVYIGANTEIGDNVIIYPGVKVMKDCKIGNNCILHPNAVIGSDGFGFVPDENGQYQKIAHVGNVIIEDDVEIGANTSIDRATMGSTIIRKGVKLDNLIQVAHNVEIGENTVMAALTGIAGSTKIGKSCRIGGQVGFAGHITIADGAQIQAQSGLIASVKEPNKALCGSPAIDYRNYFRSYAVFKQLPDLYKKINQLEKRLEKYVGDKNS